MDGQQKRHVLPGSSFVSRGAHQARADPWSTVLPHRLSGTGVPLASSGLVPREPGSSLSQKGLLQRHRGAAGFLLDISRAVLSAVAPAWGG